MSQPSSESGYFDVRMRGFARRTSVAQAWAWLDARTAPLGPEEVRLAELAGRVLSEDLISTIDVPGFPRAMMDGYAVRAADTLGAAAYNRLSLTQIGVVLPGGGFDGELGPGQTVRIMTGGPLPLGADAVLPAEKAEAQGAQILVLDDVPPGKHIGFPGEDVSRGSLVLPRGRRLRPQDLGVLSSIGVSSALAVRRPRVSLVTTGDELLPPGSRPAGSRIADANSPMLSALVQRDGGQPHWQGLVPDQPDAILAAMCGDADVVLVSGGSSVGQEDYAPALLAAHGELAIHGLAMRPSSPAGMGTLNGRLVFLLPGNPVSCLCAYDFFAGRAIRGQAGLPSGWPYRAMLAPLAKKLVSAVGRVDYARVQLIGGAVEPLAISGAAVLSSTTRADGFVVIPEDLEGYPPGAEVTVWLYD